MDGEEFSSSIRQILPIFCIDASGQGWPWNCLGREVNVMAFRRLSKTTNELQINFFGSTNLSKKCELVATIVARKTASILGAILALTLPAPAILAGPVFSSLAESIEQEWESHSVLRSTRLMSKSMGRGAPLQLGQNSPAEALRGYLRGQGLHPLLSVVAPQASPKVLGLAGPSALNVTDYSLRAGKYDVCKSSIRMIETLAGDAFVLGLAPNVDDVFVMTDEAWASPISAINLATESMQQAGVNVSGVSVTKLTKCVFPVQGELVPAWKIILRAETSPYVLYVGPTGVIEGDILAFDAVDASVRAYDSNPTSGSLKDYTIKVNGDGYLTNSYFTTADASVTPIGRSNSAANTFNGAPGTTFFPEQSSFVHVNQQRDFVEAHGYVWPTGADWPKPLTVKTHVVFSGGKVNNAQYIPFDGKSGPFIQIGDGDGTTLTNLPVDSDVVSHEFGHHVVFGSVTTTSGESLVLHEGLADSLTFLRMNDSCLGESICPAASGLCQVAGKCLRTGDNAIKYGEKSFTDLKSSPHLQGQLVSGFFWDLHKGGKIPAVELNKLLINAITFLPASAGIKDLIVAVLDADFVLYTKAYQAVILAAAEARGMSVTALGIDVASIDGQKTTETGAVPAASTSTSKKKSFLGMCSIGFQPGSTASSVWIVIGLLLPVAVQIIRGWHPVAVTVRKK